MANINRWSWHVS